MNIAVLYRKPFDLDQGYLHDSQGRGDLKHITRVRDALQSLGHKSHLVDLDLDSYERLRKAGLDMRF